MDGIQPNASIPSGTAIVWVHGRVFGWFQPEGLRLESARQAKPKNSNSMPFFSFCTLLWTRPKQSHENVELVVSLLKFLFSSHWYLSLSSSFFVSFLASRGLGLTLHSILSVWCSLSGLVWSGLVWSGLIWSGLVWSWFRLTVVLVLVLGLLDTWAISAW